MNSIEIYIVELGEVKNIWHRDFAILVDEGKGQTLLFTTYPDHWAIFITLSIHEFYYN